MAIILSLFYKHLCCKGFHNSGAEFVWNIYNHQMVDAAHNSLLCLFIKRVMKLWYSSQFPSKTSWPTFRAHRFFNRLQIILIICACPTATVLSTSSFFIPIVSFLALLRNIPCSFPMPWLMNITLSFPMFGFSNYWWSYITVLLNLQYSPINSGCLKYSWSSLCLCYLLLDFQFPRFIFCYLSLN